MKNLKTLLVGIATLVSIGCTTGGNGLAGSGSGFSAATLGNAEPPPPITGDTGAQAFLARSGFLGFASINDRAIGQNRFLAYHSRTDLLPEDKNGIDDIYLKDTKLGTTIIVSKASDGTQGNGASTQASISANGRFVVYRSAATNLVTGDTNGTEDIFMYDVLAGMTSRVSVGAGAAQSNGTSLTPAVSGDGRYVVFASEATNLVATDTNAQPDIFVRDTVSDTTSLISSNSALLDSANGASFDPAITPDGAFIALSTESTNILAAALNGTRQVVRIERATPANRVLVSQTGGAQANGPCYEPSVSNDGNIIAFFTNASNLAADTNTFFDVYVRNISGDTTTRASLDSGGGESDGHSGFPSISGDGSVVAFGSLATDLVAGDSNGVFDVFTRQAMSTNRVSVTTAGAEANVDSDLPAISLDGRYVAIRSAASNLDGNDTGFDDDIFMRDITTPTTILHSIACRIPATYGGFGAATNFASGGGCFTVVPGDFNGDGNLDIAAADEGGGRVSLLLGNGSGGLGAPTFFPVAGILVRGLTSGDFDGDGNLDVVSSHTSTDNVSILLGDGLGGFAAASNFAVGDSPFAVKAGDFNNDGDLDVVASNQNDDNLSILLGDGAGSFAAAVNFAAGDNPAGLSVADFDNDGNMDIATANFNDNTVSVLLGDGTGSFSAPLNLAVGAGPIGISATDFNRDGNVDLCVGNRDDDNVSILLGSGLGSFASATNFAIGNSPFSVATADLDGDGDQDIVAANDGSDDVGILLGDGNGSFTAAASLSAPGGSFVAIETGDFDNDGHVDIVGGATGASLIPIFLNQSPDWAGFAAAVTQTTGTSASPGPKEVSTGDVDGDGDLDLAIVNDTDNLVSIHLNNGSGTFSAATNITVGAFPTSVKLEDIDGDGDLDLITGNETDGDISTHFNDGLGNFSGRVDIAVANQPKDIVLGDVDADGDQDIVVAQFVGQGYSVLTNNGSGTFTNQGLVMTTNFLFNLELADVDGDGDLDLILGRTGSMISVHLNNGSGVFGAATLFPVSGVNLSIVATDIDGDGDPDVVVPNQLPDTISIFFNDAGDFSSRVDYPAGDAPSSARPADVDGDGDLDIVVTNLDAGNMTVLLNFGDATFAAPRPFTVGDRPLDGVIGDFDGDGDPDVVVTNNNETFFTTFLNQACP